MWGNLVAFEEKKDNELIKQVIDCNCCPKKNIDIKKERILILKFKRLGVGNGFKKAHLCHSCSKILFFMLNEPGVSKVFIEKYIRDHNFNNAYRESNKGVEKS